MSAKSQSKSGFSFLVQASKFYCDLCPEQSRFFMQKSQNMSSGVKRVVPEELFCSYCFQWRQPANHRMRPRPRRCASARVQSVLRREGRGKRLSMPQRDLLRRYRNAPSYLMATCHTCNKTSKYSGANRDMLFSVSRTHSHTPGSAAKRKTPQSSDRSNIATPKSVSKEKTLSSTPRSNSTASSSSTPASKPSSTKKSVFSRLRKFLLLDDSQKKKTKGGLKDFLSSL
ncbi:UPF0711 protein C18orf21 homolog [Hypomesus transpacificus]|uniref:UPF0711 protein C18orf21 homolog n=1 Tax=Hypomesus transpacificus TaxID=137520 RepID=UPI001F08880A|nr:UPF0711 protein C18orf21 homolog [Hypomesus transpacificus]